MNPIKTTLLITLVLLSVATAVASATYAQDVSGVLLVSWALLFSVVAVTPFAWLLAAGEHTPSTGTLILVGANTFLIGHFLLDPGYFLLAPFVVMALLSATFAFARKLLAPLLLTSLPIITVVFAHRLATFSLGASTEGAYFWMAAVAASAMGLFVTGVGATVTYWVLASLFSKFVPGAEPRLGTAASVRIGYGAISAVTVLSIPLLTSPVVEFFHPFWGLQLLMTPLVALVVAEMYLRSGSARAQREVVG